MGFLHPFSERALGRYNKRRKELQMIRREKLKALILTEPLKTITQYGAILRIGLHSVRNDWDYLEAQGQIPKQYSRENTSKLFMQKKGEPVTKINKLERGPNNLMLFDKKGK